MRNSWKKTAAFVLAFTLVAAPLTQTGEKSKLFSKTSITAYATPATVSKTVSWDADEMFASGDSSFSKDGVTVEAENGDAHLDENFYDYGKNTFKADGGKITKIEILCYSCEEIGGWTKEVAEKFQPEPESMPGYWKNIYKLTWTGEADSVTIQNCVFEIQSLKVTYTPSAVAVSGVQLNKTETNLTVGGNETLTATVSPDDATDKTVTWSSDNTDVATVDENGKITAVGAGTANITATATNGTDETDDDKTATCAVTVNAITPAFSNASVTLGDDLALNFYVDNVTAETAADYTVNFTGACVDESSALVYNADNGKYYATTHVYAKDIDKDITATLCKGDDTIDTFEDYSITQYLTVAAGESPDAETDALIDATTKFGYASAEYFYGDDYGVTAAFESYNPDVAAYAPSFTSEDALFSLVLDSKTAARLYVKGDDTGEESTISSTKADYPTYHEVTGLLPQNLADEKTINVGGTDYTFSALSWCNRVLSNTSASAKNTNMAKAIMAYYEAAKNYR